MSPLVAGGLVLGGLGAIGNWAAQARNNKWQRHAQQITWEREDNAQQRAVADLQAAGLSPTLAAGSPAQVHTPIKPDAPHLDATAPLEGASMALKLSEQAKQIEQTDAQIDLLRAEEQGKKLMNEKTAIQLKHEEPLRAAELDRQTIENNFNRVANPERLKKMASEIRNLDASTELKRVEHKLKTVQVSREEFAGVVDKVRGAREVAGLAQDQKNLVAAQLAIELKEEQLRMLQHDREWFMSHRLPSTTRPSDITVSQNQARSTLRDVGARVVEGLENLFK